MIEDQKPIRKGRFAPGVSGNPAGRPPLVPSEALRKDLACHASELLDKAIFEALNGDNTVLVFLLNRLIAPYKPTHQPLNIETSDNSTLALANRLMVEAVSSGSPDSALACLSGLKTVLEVQSVTEIQTRLEALEQRLLTVNGR